MSLALYYSRFFLSKPFPHKTSGVGLRISNNYLTDIKSGILYYPSSSFTFSHLERKGYYKLSQRPSSLQQLRTDFSRMVVPYNLYLVPLELNERSTRSIYLSFYGPGAKLGFYKKFFAYTRLASLPNCTRLFRKLLYYRLFSSI